MGTALEYWPFVFFAFVSICIGMLYWDERRRRIALETRFAAVLDATQEANRIMRSVKLRAQKVEENLRADAEAIQAAALADKAQTIKQAQDDVKFIHADAQSRLQAAEQSEKVAEVRVEGLEAEAQGLRDQITQLQLDYSQKRSIFDALSKQVAIFDDKLAFAEMGVYERHFDFTDSDQFRAAIEETRNAQKRLISEANAVVCTTEWQVKARHVSLALGRLACCFRFGSSLGAYYLKHTIGECRMRVLRHCCRCFGFFQDASWAFISASAHTLNVMDRAPASFASASAIFRFSMGSMPCSISARAFAAALRAVASPTPRSDPRPR